MIDVALGVQVVGAYGIEKQDNTGLMDYEGVKLGPWVYRESVKIE